MPYERSYRMNEIDQLQAEITRWCEHNFKDENRLSVTLGMVEEAGEVARAVLKQYQGIRGSHEEWDAKIQEEVGDVMIKLVHIAMVCGFNLHDAIWQRWDVVNERDWSKDRIGHGMP